jgi:hypothetical protein
VLRTSPESDALVVLGRLLDSLPIGFHVSDCGGGLFHILYANRVWEHWLDPEKLPIAGKTLADLFPSAEASMWGPASASRTAPSTARKPTR